MFVELKSEHREVLAEAHDLLQEGALLLLGGSGLDFKEVNQEGVR